jgi:hypothetical protein
MRAVSLVVLFAACGGSVSDADEDELDSISDQRLQGIIGGEGWAYAGGETDSFLSDETEFFTTFYGVSDGEDCGFAGGGDTDFILSVPNEIGSFPFSFTLNATFTFGDNENVVTFDGTVRVDTIGDDELTGGVYAVFDDDNEIDGTFTVSRCPSE